MENHPLPQQISSYKFRLVGDMTLNQFFKVAGGVLLSLIFYSTNLPALIKWFFILLFSILGVAFAFVPFQDRSLDKWFLSFIKSVYSPTIFFWEKTNKNTTFFQKEAPFSQEKIIALQGKEKLKKHFSTKTSLTTPFLDKLEKGEKTLLEKIGNILTFDFSKSKEDTINQPKTAEKLVGKKQEFIIPKPQLVSYGSQTKPVAQEKLHPLKKTTTEKVSETFKTQKNINAMTAQFSIDAAPPAPPTLPNTIVGQVIDDKAKIVESAILEIRDVSGRPVRALKSNKLGHFTIVTPLQNGNYQILTEKEGYSFNPVKFETQGGIVPPIAIKGKQKITPTISENN